MAPSSREVMNTRVPNKYIDKSPKLLANIVMEEVS